MKLADMAEYFKLKKANKHKKKVEDNSKLGREPLDGDGYFASAGETKAQNDGNSDLAG